MQVKMNGIPVEEFKNTAVINVKVNELKDMDYQTVLEEVEHYATSHGMPPEHINNVIVNLEVDNTTEITDSGLQAVQEAYKRFGEVGDNVVLNIKTDSTGVVEWVMNQYETVGEKLLSFVCDVMDNLLM